MDLELTQDQEDLRAIAAEALDARAPLRIARAYLDGEPAAEPLHAELLELGWYAVGLDDDFGLPGLALLAREVGARAAPTGLVDTAVGARLAAPADHPAADGGAAIALAVVEAGSDWSLRGQAASVTGGRLTGRKVDVQHAASARTFCVTVVGADGRPAVAFVDAGGAGVSVQEGHGADPAQAQAVVSFQDAEVTALLEGTYAAEALGTAFAVGAVAITAEGLGAASAALDLAIAYAHERHQFGVPIGTFQSLKHLMAGAHVEREAAWSSVLHAAAALDEELDDAIDAMRIAKAYGARASRSIVEVAVQVLGGIAFTWEHDVHLLQRRVLSTERRFGDAIFHERRIGDALAIPPVEVTA
jgi:alkylation response protein AidB-like acyl-CoA dehydrogenase